MKTKDKVANAIKWIDGLLVTTVKQGKTQLGNKETGFCCLGYGCHILDVDYADYGGFNSDFTERVGLEYDNSNFYPEVHIHGADICESLAMLNDRAGWSFNQIAKFMISRDFSMFEDKVAAQLVEHYNKAKLAADH